jgi:hypothetical protein
MLVDPHLSEKNDGVRVLIPHLHLTAVTPHLNVRPLASKKKLGDEQKRSLAIFEESFYPKKWPKI